MSGPTRGGSADSYLYTCKTCESANFVDRVSYNVTACLVTEYVYPNPNANPDPNPDPNPNPNPNPNLDPNQVTACLFTEYVYPNPAMERARKGHNCRYFDDAPLAAVCKALGQGDANEHRELRGNYGWFCGDAIPLLAAAAKAALL